MESVVVLSQSQWSLVLASLFLGGLALAAGAVWSILTRKEIAPGLRTASDAGTCLLVVAFLAYVGLVITWVTGFDLRDGLWHPAAGLKFDIGLRYVDWTVTVPLLMVEITAVLALSTAARQRLRTVVLPASLLMIVTGYVGTDPASHRDADHGPLLLWGAISTVFFLVTFGALYPVLFKDVRSRSEEEATSLRNLSLLLLATWGVYPVVYLFPVFFGTTSAGAATTREVVLSVTDVIAKAGYTVLIHKIGVLATRRQGLAVDDRVEGSALTAAVPA